MGASDMTPLTTSKTIDLYDGYTMGWNSSLFCRSKEKLTTTHFFHSFDSFSYSLQMQFFIFSSDSVPMYFNTRQQPFSFFKLHSYRYAYQIRAQCENIDHFGFTQILWSLCHHLLWLSPQFIHFIYLFTFYTHTYK